MSSIQITWFYRSTNICLGLTKGRGQQRANADGSHVGPEEWVRNAELVSMRRDCQTLEFEPSSFRYEGIFVGDIQAGHSSLPLEFEEAIDLHLEDGVSAFLEQYESAENSGSSLQTKKLNSNFTFKFVKKVESLNLNRVPVSQWLGAINNLKGVRAWEKEWCGLWQWLESIDSDRKVSKEEVLDHIDFHVCELSLYLTWTNEGITLIQFDACNFPLTTRLRRKIGGDGYWTIIRYKNPSWGYRVLETVRPDLYDKGHWWRVADRKNNILDPGKVPAFSSPHEAIDFARRCASKTHPLRGNIAPSRQWLDYSLAENEYREYLVVLENFPAEFKSDHFDLRNVLIHLRTTVNFDHSAERVLLVEELQSDWLQKPKNRRLKGKQPGVLDLPVPLVKEWAKVGVLLSIWLAIQSQCTSVAWSNWQMQLDHYGRFANRHGLKKFYDRDLPKIVSKVSNEFGCPASDSAIFIDGIESQCVRLEDQWVLEDTSGSILVGPARSKNALLLSAIEKGLLNSQRLLTLKISDTLRKELLREGVSI